MGHTRERGDHRLMKGGESQEESEREENNRYIVIEMKVRNFGLREKCERKNSILRGILKVFGMCRNSPAQTQLAMPLNTL